MLNYYYLQLSSYNSYEEYIYNIKLSLCCFPYFVCIWFNTENIQLLNDKNFPVRFMKNYIQYLEYLIDDDFIINL